MGNSEYSCSRVPEKAACISAKEVYKETNNGKSIVSIKKENQEDPKAQTKSGRGGVPIEPSMDKVIKNFVSPNLPDKPVPVRTPATVMKIWVNTYEDKSGDLVTPGYVFTEIEPRRWVVGKRTATGAPVLKPLSQKGNSKKTN